MATRPNYPLLTAKQFREFSFGDRKAELDNGVIRMMDGGTAKHCSVQGNILAELATKLRGTGFVPYPSSMALRTHERSVRHPDVAVYPRRSDPQYDDVLYFEDPLVIVEIHDAGTARTDLNSKVPEYKALPSVDTIVLIDIARERLHIYQRTATNGWNEQAYADPVDLDLPSLGIAIPHNEIFARD